MPPSTHSSIPVTKLLSWEAKTTQRWRFRTAATPGCSLEVSMPSTIRKVSYAYVTAASKPGEAARILNALRDAKVNLLAFSGFPQGRNNAQINVVTDDLDALKAVARGRK